MLETVRDIAVISEARKRLTAALDGPVDLADSWLGSLPGVALVEESGRSPDGDQAKRLALSLARLGEHRLMAVATEYLAGTDDVYRLTATEADLVDFAYARSGMNYALMPASGLQWLILCTVHDYLLVAGKRPFVEDYAGDPAMIAGDFRALVEGDADWEHPTNRRLLRHLSWIDEV